MKKKQVITLKNALYFVPIVLSIVAICMLFVTALSYNYTVPIAGEQNFGFTGVEAVFGKENFLAFSFMNLLSYIFVLVAAIFAVLRLFGVLKSKLFDYVIVALFVVAAIFFFLNVQFVVWTESVKTVINTFDVKFVLGAGPIVAGVLSLVSAASVAVASTRK